MSNHGARCYICGQSHVAAGLSCNESKMVHALAVKLFDVESERPEAREGTYEAIAEVVRRCRP